MKSTLSPNERRLKNRSIMTKVFGQSVIWLVLIVMYIPIMVFIMMRRHQLN